MADAEGDPFKMADRHDTHMLTRAEAIGAAALAALALPLAGCSGDEDRDAADLLDVIAGRSGAADPSAGSEAKRQAQEAASAKGGLIGGGASGGADAVGASGGVSASDATALADLGIALLREVATGRAATPGATADGMHAASSTADRATGAGAAKAGAHATANALVSPVGAAVVLGMAACGAQGETLSQIQTLTGLPLDELNRCMRACASLLTSSATATVKVAGNLWANTDAGVTPSDAFRQALSRWYAATPAAASFRGGLRPQVDSWAGKATGGLVASVDVDVPASDELYLASVQAFEARWATAYGADDVTGGTFTTGDGTRQDVDFLASTEPWYLSDPGASGAGVGASGVAKPYAGNAYALVALLPDEGATVADYLAGLTGERLRDVLMRAEAAQVDTLLPRFVTTQALDLAPHLTALGMTDAFDEAHTDLSGVSDLAGLHLGPIGHVTHVALTETGTSAVASSAGTAVASTAADGKGASDGEPHEVHLDRPFVMFVVEQRTLVPLVAAVINDIDEIAG